MFEQPSLLENVSVWDAKAAREAAEDGMQTAAEHKASLLKHARKVAREVAIRKGEISMDDVARELQGQGVSIFALGNAAGSVFRGDEWEFCNRMVKSERAHSHGNLLRVWRLRGE